MNQRSYKSITGTIFLIITILHLLRIINVWSAQIGMFEIPMWASWVAVVIAGCLAYQGLKRG